jgi:hypothetical protein
MTDGKDTCRKYEATYDAQQIYAALYHMGSSAVAVITSQKLF